LNKIIATIILVSSAGFVAAGLAVAYRAEAKRRRIKDAESLGTLLGAVYKNRENF
jgi:heme/copper-type cytochrome/quinol oxidase subunit 3